MIDKFFYAFFGWVDKVSQSLPNIFKDEPKAKKKRIFRCKKCGCKCHCKKALHQHWWDLDLCACDTCRH